ncbi:MAG: TlpA disulfide reductase family protein [Bacteroidales bacterium]
MKYLLITAISVLISLSGYSQTKKLPSVDVKTAQGETIDISQIDNEGNPIIISLWATWCKPCINELNTISEVYPDWQEETGVKLVAISVDDSRSNHKVMPMVNSNYWDYDIYMDPNQNLKRALNVNMIPQTFLLNGDKEIVWQHTSFSEGSELELIELVRKVKAGEDISNEE